MATITLSKDEQVSVVAADGQTLDVSLNSDSVAALILSTGNPLRS